MGANELSQMNTVQNKIRQGILLLAVFLGTALVMFVYEFLKESLSGGALSAWQSHAITIVVTATLATTASLILSQRALSIDATNRTMLEEREFAIRTLADNLPINVHRCTPDGRTLYINKTLETTLGIPAAYLIGKTASEANPCEGSVALDEAVRHVGTSGEPLDFEFALSDPTGVQRRHQIHIVPELGPNGLTETILVVGRDVTEQRQMEDELRLAASVFHNSSEGVLITDANSIILSVNPAFTEITGYLESEALGRKPGMLKSDRHDSEFYRVLWQTLLESGKWEGEIWNRRKSGEAYLQWLTINRIVDAKGEVVRYVSVFRDITEIRNLDERIRYLAFHDALTGLPNRALFQERLEHAVERMRRDNGRLSVSFLDLDGFKNVNDTLGHDMGDLLLQEVAKRIRTHLRRGVDTVARLGGDEFVVLMEDLKETEHCACLAGEIIDDISRPVELRDQTVRVGASIGIAFFPENGETALELMRRADTAMYAAKHAGKNTYHFFCNDMLETIDERLAASAGKE